MGKWISEFGQFIGDMFHHWVGKMTGLLSIILAIAPVAAPKFFEGDIGLLHNRWIWWAAAAGSFLIASRMEWGEQKIRASEAEAKLRQIEDAKPRIILSNAYTDRVGVNENGVQVCIANVLRIKLENAPQHRYPTNEAKNVTAKVSFYNSSTEVHIRDMDARWTASTQPVGPHTLSIIPLLGMDFPIGAKRDLDIAFAEMTYIKTPLPSLVALNNDNFRFQRWRKPEHILPGDRFVAKIRVSAVWVDTEISVEFWAMPQGEIGFRELDTK